MKLIYLTILFTSLSPALYSQNVEINLFPEKLHKKIDYELNKYLKIHKVNGFSLVLANKGRIVLSKSYGFSDELKRIPLTPSHRMYMLETTRVITAAAIMKLLQENKLTLEDNVFGPNSILGANAPTLDKNLLQLTIRHLLELTTDKSWYQSKLMDRLSQSDHLLNIRTIIRNSKFRQKPGAKAFYSKVPYYILGRVIEKISGKTYIEYIQDMTKGSIKGELSIMGDRNRNNLVWQPPSTGFKRWHEHTEYDSFKGLVCSPADMMHIILGMDGSPTQKDFLLDATVKIMKAPTRAGPYLAKGWNIRDAGDFVYFDTERSAATFIKMRLDGITWVLSTNGGSKNRGFYNNSIKLADDLIKKLKSIP